MKTKTLKINWSPDPNVEPKEVEVTMKRLSFGELNKVQDDAVDIKITGTQPIANVNQSKFKEMSILRSLCQAPFEINLTNIQKLDPIDGNKLWEVFQELNEQTKQ